MSDSQVTRAIAECSRRRSTWSGTSPTGGRMRPSSARNTASSSPRRSARRGSTSGSQPGGRSSRGMSSRVRGCWLARQAQNLVPRSSSSRTGFLRLVKPQGQRLRNATRSLADRPQQVTSIATKLLPAQTVTNSLHGRNIRYLTRKAGEWERLPTLYGSADKGAGAMKLSRWAGAGAAAALAAGLAACSSSSPSSGSGGGTATASSTASGGTLVVETSFVLKTLDPGRMFETTGLMIDRVL